jgi:hypothetical protein
MYESKEVERCQSICTVAPVATNRGNQPWQPTVATNRGNQLWQPTVNKERTENPFPTPLPLPGFPSTVFPNA